LDRLPTAAALRYLRRVTAGIDKRALLEAVRARVAADLEAVTTTQRETHAGATHEESRPENDKDTRALEASYLARGLARRVGELEDAVRRLAAVELRGFAEDDAIAATAVVDLEDDDGRSQRYFLLPAGGGVKVDAAGGPVQVLTPGSPLGRLLLGKRVDDQVELRTPRGARALAVTAVA
jgi:transcription elongation GreA/GreB family factor